MLCVVVKGTRNCVYFVLSKPFPCINHSKKFQVQLRNEIVPGNRAHILLGGPLNLFFSTILHKYVLRVLLLWLIFFKNSTHVIYRGEGKNTVAIALGQADPLVLVIYFKGGSPVYPFFTGCYLSFYEKYGITFPRRPY